MSGYEGKERACALAKPTNLTRSTVEHSIPSEERQQQQQARRRRPDLGTFFSTLDLADTSDSRQNENSIPLPQDVSAAFQTLANAFSQMRGGGNEDHDNSELLGGLIESLMASAEHPPTQLQGVPDEFIEQLERIPKKNLKPDESCPICANPFLEGMVLSLHTRR